jgi:hypothetical protein
MLNDVLICTLHDTIAGTHFFYIFYPAFTHQKTNGQNTAQQKINGHFVKS